MRETFKTAGDRALRVMGAGAIVVVALALFGASRERLAALELAAWPVLGPITLCNGEGQGWNRGPVHDLTDCGPGGGSQYEGFKVTSAVCKGEDLLTRGYLVKVRNAAIDTSRSQVFVQHGPDGIAHQVLMAFERPTPGSRPAMPRPQAWGAWTLYGACLGGYDRWFATVEHRPWHKLWWLKTHIGPFPIPQEGTKAF